MIIQLHHYQLPIHDADSELPYCGRENDTGSQLKSHRRKKIEINP